MQSNDQLDSQDIESRLKQLGAGWEMKDGKLYRQFTFDDFASAFSFMTRIAIIAETQNHHPEWFNVYNRVEVWLTTHDAGGVTQKDFALASAMDNAFS